jgi:hypothetical protein
MNTEVISKTEKFSLKGTGIGKVPEAISIHERPVSVEDRAIS